MNLNRPQHLQLVPTAMDAATTAVQTCAWELASAEAVQKSIYSPTLKHMIGDLASDEMLVFSHQLEASHPDTNAGDRYAFEVSFVHSGRNLARRAQIEQQLLAACPHIQMHPAAPLSASATHADSREHTVRLVPASVVLCASSSLTDSRTHAPMEHALAFPADLSNYSLSSLLDMQAQLPQHTAVHLRVRAIQISPRECEELEWLRRRIEHGPSLLAFHPHTPYRANFSVSKDLADKSCALLAHWLRQPLGYVMDVIVQSSQPLATHLMNRLAANIFGELPYENEIFSVDIWHTWKPKIAQAISFNQGFPAFFPDLTEIHRFGIPRHYPEPENLPACTQGVVIGTTANGIHAKSVVQPDLDRFSHTAVFGASGSGKSTFLLNLFAQTLLQPERPGTMVIDPHGQLFADCLRLIPERRQQDVIVFDVTDRYGVTSFNPFAGTHQDKQLAAQTVDAILSMIDVLMESSNSAGPTTKSHLKHALTMATIHPDYATFSDVLRCFDDRDYRDYLLSKADDSLRRHFDQFAQTTGDTGFTNWLPYIKSRLDPFVNSPVMRRVTSAPKSSLDLDKALADGNKIILCNISSATLGASATRLLGNMLMSRLFFSAMRHNSFAERVQPMHLLVDEASTMMSETTAAMIEQARKFGLSLCFANQSLGQLQNRHNQSGGMAEALLANSATKVMFRLSPQDAGRLEPYVDPQFGAAELTKLPVFTAAISLSANGAVLPAFAMKVARPEMNSQEQAKAIVSASRVLHSIPIHRVVQNMMDKYDAPNTSFSSYCDASEQEQIAMFEQAERPATTCAVASIGVEG